MVERTVVCCSHIATSNLYDASILGMWLLSVVLSVISVHGGADRYTPYKRLLLPIAVLLFVHADI